MVYIMRPSIIDDYILGMLNSFANTMAYIVTAFHVSETGEGQEIITHPNVNNTLELLYKLGFGKSSRTETELTTKTYSILSNREPYSSTVV